MVPLKIFLPTHFFFQRTTNCVPNAGCWLSQPDIILISRGKNSKKKPKAECVRREGRRTQRTKVVTVIASLESLTLGLLQTWVGNFTDHPFPRSLHVVLAILLNC